MIYTIFLFIECNTPTTVWSIAKVCISLRLSALHLPRVHFTGLGARYFLGTRVVDQEWSSEAARPARVPPKLQPQRIGYDCVRVLCSRCRSTLSPRSASYTQSKKIKL